MATKPPFLDRIFQPNSPNAICLLLSNPTAVCLNINPAFGVPFTL